MEKINYQLELDRIINGLNGRKSLLLHACCAPCASYVLEYLVKYFDITVFFYNPNIYPESEYKKRYFELVRLIKIMDCGINLIEGEYEPEKYNEYAAGLEKEREGGLRCEKCFELRLDKTAVLAANQNYDFFATTLTVSPHKNEQLINKIGFETAERNGCVYLPSDFKKREGYKRSIEICREYDIYRQNYCGCVYAMKTE